MTKQEWLEKHDYENVTPKPPFFIIKYKKCLDEEEGIYAVISFNHDCRDEWKYYIESDYGFDFFDENDLDQLRVYLDIVKKDFEDMIKESE